MHRRLFSLALAAACLGPVGLAEADEACRSNRSEPKWVEKPPIGYQFDYSVGQGRGMGRSPTVSAAIKNAISTLLNRNKIRVTSLSTIREVVHALNEVGVDGEKTSSETSTTDVDDQITIQSAGEVLQGLQVVETYEQDCGSGQYDVRALIRVKSKHPRAGGPPNYYVSSWVPSLAQFQKEDTGKAYVILFGEVALVGSSALFFILSDDAFNQAATATTQSDRDFYNDRGSLQRNLGIGLAVAAGGLYVYNLLDGMLAEDTLHYASSEPAGPVQWAVAPVEGGAVGFASLTF